MQAFIKLQNILSNPKRTFDDFKTELIKSEINQSTYLCLLLNHAATLKRPGFNFQAYLDLLVNFKSQPGFRSACINYTGYKDKISILMNACEKSVLSTVKALATHPDIKLHAVDPNGFNAVFYAIRNVDQTEGIRILQLLDQTSPSMIDTVCNNGYSPLFLSVERCKLKITEFLLRQGIDSNMRLISTGNTALHEMVRAMTTMTTTNTWRYTLQQAREMVQMFLRYDFDIHIRNNQYKTVQQYSDECGKSSHIAEMIRQLLQQQLQGQKGDQERNNNNAKQSYSETTQVYSSTRMTNTTKTVVDAFTFTLYQHSQLQRSECYNRCEIDASSTISHKSLLSEQVNCGVRHQQDQRELSLDISIHNQSVVDIGNDDNNNDNNNDELDLVDASSEIDFIIQKELSCESLSESKPQQFTDCFELSQNLLARVDIGKRNEEQQAGQNVREEEVQENEQQQQQQCQSLQSSISDTSSNPSQPFLRTQHVDFPTLHRQILQFSQINQQIYFSTWKQIQPFFIKLTSLVDTLGLTIQVIGSFATGLWTHHSDIDIALVTQIDNFVDFEKLLQKLFSKLKIKMYDMGIKQLNYNKSSKIPSLKIQMDPYLFSSRKIDIMITHRRNIAITYVGYIRQALVEYEQIRPLFFFLKRACEEFGLHDPFNGGMKSYSIFLIINSIIRSLELTNLGEILLKISLYFGFYHTYDYDINYQHNINLDQVECFAVERLNIADPLNTKNNMGGRNTNVLRLKNMFRTIYYGIHRHNGDQTKLQQILQMAQLII